MKKYIGTKLIEAEKIVRVDGKMQPFDWPIPNGSKVEHGYKVRYADGYESFSPKAVFEKAYMPLEPNKKLKTDAPSISKKMVDDFIAEIHVSTLGEKTTVVRAVLVNGFEIVESSSCVSKENYDQNLGKDICMEKIVGKIWYLLGFLLQTAVGGIEKTHSTMLVQEGWSEPVRDLEQEYENQVKEEQACEACEECCDCCNDTGTAEPAENEKTDNEECTPPMDRMWESETDSYTAKNYSFDSAEKLKEKLTSEVDIPEDGNKVFIHITEEEDGHLQSVIIGSPIKTIPALEAVFVETTLGAFEKDAPDFIKKLMVTTAVASMKNKLMDALKCSEKK